MNTTATQQEQTTYTDVRCDNVVWEKHLRDFKRCNMLLLRLRSDADLGQPGVVWVDCRRCGKRHYLPREDKAA